MARRKGGTVDKAIDEGPVLDLSVFVVIEITIRDLRNHYYFVNQMILLT